MPVRDYFVPPNTAYLRPSFARASLESPSDQHSGNSSCRRTRLQVQTDLYVHLDPDPKHKLAHCSTVYELDDRTKPSISSF